MKNICRAITFYNNFLPAGREKSPWEFCAFGVLDGMSVSQAIIADGDNILQCIWDSQKQFYNEKMGEYTAQRIYAVRYDEPKRESDFWENQELPFYFLCRIQCNGNSLFLEENRIKLETICKKENETDVISYMTYDNSDLLIIFKTKKYSIGIGLICDLQSSCSAFLKNSFTIFSVHYDWISSKKFNKEELNKEKIDTVLINLIERENGNIDRVESKLKECLEKEVTRIPLLGTDDDLIILSQVGWGDFLELYKRDGVLNKRNELYIDNLAAVTTEICVKQGDNTSKLTNLKLIQADSSCNHNNKEIYVETVNKLRSIVEKDRAFSEFNEIKIILNILPKFTGEIFNDYTYFPILKPIGFLLKLIQIKSKKYIDKEPFYEFLDGFNAYVQSSLMLDRAAVQRMNFNTKIYDIPPKLNAFFYAYLYKIKKILNKKTECTYEFLIVPGTNDIVNVVELYKQVSSKMRLLKVEIPEYSFYQISSMMIILTHEAAHYIGRVYRSREERYKNFIANYAHAFVKYVRFMCNDHFREEFAVSINDDMWEIAEIRFRTLLEDVIERQWNVAYHSGIKTHQIDSTESEDIVYINREYSQYLYTISKNIRIVMPDIIQYGLDSVFAPFLYQLGNEKEEIIRYLRECSERFIAINPDENTNVNSINILYGLRGLYEESFADIMSIKILDLSAEEYLNNFLNNATVQNITLEELCKSEAFIRILVVVLSMLRAPESDWKSEVGNMKGDSKEIVKWILSVIKAYKNNKILADEETDYFALVYDYSIITNVADYLCICIQKFDDKINNKTAELEEIRKIFRCLSEENDSRQNCEEQIVEMVQFINNYKREIFNDMKQREDEEGE